MTSFLGAPIRIGDRVFGNLYLTDKIGADQFSKEDEELAVALASVAGMVIENARLYEKAREHAASLAAADRELERLAVIEDRERIGRELHDTVVQRLFAAGMALQGAVQQVHPDRPQVATRINDVIDDLDATIRQIRTAIFELQATGDQPAGVRASFTGVIAEASRLLGKSPELILQGPIDTLVTRELGDHAVSVMREALANVLRHANAEQTWVRVAADSTGFVVEVSDDGVGPDEDVLGGRGLANMRRRAKMLGGEFRLERQDGRTTATWRVPLS
jgi:signal transduction histidine kinase